MKKLLLIIFLFSYLFCFSQGGTSNQSTGGVNLGSSTSLVAGSGITLTKGVKTTTITATNLATGLTGIVPIINGGTNTSVIGSAGSVIYSNGTQMTSSSVGTAGQVLASGGASVPTWTTLCTSSLCDVGGWVDYSATSTIVGFSAYTIKIIKYKKTSANTLLVKYFILGTGSGTSTSFTIPFTSNADANWYQQAACGQAYDGLYAAGTAQISPNVSTIVFLVNYGLTWTNGVTRKITGEMTIEIQ